MGQGGGVLEQKARKKKGVILVNFSRKKTRARMVLILLAKARIGVATSTPECDAAASLGSLGG